MILRNFLLISGKIGHFVNDLLFLKNELSKVKVISIIMLTSLAYHYVFLMGRGRGGVITNMQGNGHSLQCKNLC